MQPALFASVEHEMLVVMGLEGSVLVAGNLEAPFTWLASKLFCPCLVVNLNNRAKVNNKKQKTRKKRGKKRTLSKSRSFRCTVTRVWQGQDRQGPDSHGIPRVPPILCASSCTFTTRTSTVEKSTTLA